MSRVLRIVQRCRGIRLGPCEEVFEMGFLPHESPLIEEIMGWLATPGAVWGRAYDGAYCIQVPHKHEWVFSMTPGVVRFSDRYSGWIMMRFRPGELERRLRQAVGREG